MWLGINEKVISFKNHPKTLPVNPLDASLHHTHSVAEYNSIYITQINWTGFDFFEWSVRNGSSLCIF